jgi:hypothetical protein
MKAKKKTKTVKTAKLNKANWSFQDWLINLGAMFTIISTINPKHFGRFKPTSSEIALMGDKGIEMKRKTSKIIKVLNE